MSQQAPEEKSPPKSGKDAYIKNNSGDSTFQHFATCLRVKYPKKTVDYFVTNFDMVLLHQNEIKEKGITLYYLVSSKANTKYPDTSSKEAEQLLWSYDGGVLQLEYHDGDDTNDKFIINSGNTKPFRGFGHIAFNTNDVFAACTELEKNNVSFKKKPNEGRMKGLAFAYDPNGYWIEIVSRRGADKPEKYNLSQTMLRVKDPAKSLKFYCDILGMRMVSEKHFEKGAFSLFFLSSFANDADLDKSDGSDVLSDVVKTLWPPVLELTHNWGTEKGGKDAEIYHDGTTPCELGVGFAKLSFLTDKVSGMTEMFDPDGYKVQLQERGKNPTC
eukprot:167105_1